MFRDLDPVLGAPRRSRGLELHARPGRAARRAARPARRGDRGPGRAAAAARCGRTGGPCWRSCPEEPSERAAPSRRRGLTAPGRAEAARRCGRAHRCANGLRVVACARPGVPLVELRLRVPFGGTAPSHPARSSAAGRTRCWPVRPTHDQVELAAALQALGAELSVGVDSDRLIVGGAVLRTGLPALLGLLAEVVKSASYPTPRSRASGRGWPSGWRSLRSQPSVLVGEALAAGSTAPTRTRASCRPADAVQAVTPAQLRKLHARPGPARRAACWCSSAICRRPARWTPVEAALSDWTGRRPASRCRRCRRSRRQPLLLVDRPGSVQSSIRLGGPAVPPRGAGLPGAAAGEPRLRRLLLLPAGGEHPRGQGLHVRSAQPGQPQRGRLPARGRRRRGDRGDGAGAAGDLVRAGPDGDAADHRRRSWRTSGSTRSARWRCPIATQAGLASTLSALIGVGLGLDWLREHPRRLATVTLEETFAAARAYLAPAGLIGRRARRGGRDRRPAGRARSG